MSQTVSIWLVVALAFLAANLPFLSQRGMAIIALPWPKSPWIRLAELLAFYFLAGGVGLLLEQRAGQIAPQTWEFYAVTWALFLTFAFPGFTYRFLLKRND